MKCSSLLLALVALTSSAGAATLTIANHSFEDPALDPGAWRNEVATGWVTGPETGTRAFVEHITGFVADGTNHHGMELGISIWQELSVAWEANTAYSLIVGVGNRNESFSPAGNASTIYLESTADPVGTFLASASLDASTLPASTFGDLTLNFTTGDVAPAGNIRIRLSAEGAGRGHFDNVRLTADLIPEPSVAALSLLGLLGLSRRRK